MISYQMKFQLSAPENLVQLLLGDPFASREKNQLVIKSGRILESLIPVLAIIGKRIFFGLSPTGHRSRQPRLWRGIGGNGSVQRLNRPQIEHRQRVGERRGAGELIVPPP